MQAQALSELNRLIDSLVDGVQGNSSAAGQAGGVPAGGSRRSIRNASEDAIDAVLMSASRETAVQSLRESSVVERFRDELTDGLIRVDTAHQLLQLVNTLISRFL